jgi:hypothetical protein
MKKLAMLLFVLALCVQAVDAASIDLGTAGSFGVLAGAGVTNAVDGTFINGDVGSSPTVAIDGLLTADVNGILYFAGGANVVQAKLDLVAAYNAAAGAMGGVPGPAELGGATLLPGVYTYTEAASWTFGAGNLTLDANGDSSAQWIFKIGTTLVTPANVNVLLIRSASANNVFWQIGSSLTTGANNTFTGNILAYTSITLGGGTLNGRALARNGAVTISGAVEAINVPGFVLGKASVPVVTADQTLADANTAITGAGLIVGTITYAYSDTVAAGLVISQDPAGETDAAGGSAVDMVVSLGPPLIPVNKAVLVYKVNQSSLSGWQLDFNDSSRRVDIDSVDPCDPNQQPPLNAEWDTTTLSSAQPSSSKITGYIVMDVNVSTLRINDLDPKGDPNAITPHDAAAISDGVGLIIIDKKAKTYQVIYKTWTPDADKTDWVADANYGSIGNDGIFKAVVVKNKNGKVMPKKTLGVFGLEADVYSSNLDDGNGVYEGDVDGVYTWAQGHWEWDFSTMTGALSNVDIDGSKVKVLVPKSLKGLAWVANSGTIGTQTTKVNSKTTVITRSVVRTSEDLPGKASMALDVKLTKKANAGPVKGTTSSTMDEIISSLPSGYKEVPNVANAVDPED